MPGSRNMEHRGPDIAPLMPQSLRTCLVNNTDSLGLAVAIVVAIIVFSLASPFFFDIGNFYNIGRAVSVYGLIAAVSTIMLISGGLDLSLSAVIALGGVVAAHALGAFDNTGLALIAAAIAGTAAGLINAFLIIGVGINPLIATIGTQFALRGLIFIVSGAAPVSVFQHKSFMALGNGTLLGIPSPIIILIGVFLIVAAVMRYTRFGSRAYAIGGSAVSAELAGLPVAQIRVVIYLLSAIAAACGGALLASVNGAAYPNVGIGAELTILSSVILGGTALAGGRGTVAGTFLGVLLLGIMNNGLNLLGVSAEGQMFAQGVILILAVTFDEYRRRRGGLT